MEPLAIHNPFPGAAAFHVGETTSTMDEARRLAALGFPAGTVISADLQTAGRGRFPERRWEAAEEANLLATVILPREAASLPGFPIRMGLAACRAIDLFCLRTGSYPPEPPRLKWPNDILLAGKKTAGILCEAKGEATYAGFGINLSQRRFPPELEGRATSLALALGHPEGAPALERDALLEILLDQVAVVLPEERWREEAEAILWMRGGEVTFIEGLPASGRRIAGLLAGIAPDGALLIEVKGERAPRSLAAGELVTWPGRELTGQAPII